NVSATGIHCSAMKAAILHGPHELRVEASRTPEPGGNDALVRVAVAGLCGTDYSIFSGDRRVSYPRVMGHEFVGRVEAVGAGVTTPRVGDRVVIEPNYSCGVCPLCREGNRNLCLARTAVGIDVDGCFAELVRVPVRCCWAAPAGVADEDLMVTEPLAVVVRAVARGQVRPGGRVVLTGLPHEATAVPFFSVVRREVTIVGSMIYQDEFAEAMRLVAAGEVRTRPLITHRFALDEIERAFVAHREPAAIKVALVV